MRFIIFRIGRLWRWWRCSLGGPTTFRELFIVLAFCSEGVFLFLQADSSDRAECFLEFNHNVRCFGFYRFSFRFSFSFRLSSYRFFRLLQD